MNAPILLLALALASPATPQASGDGVELRPLDGGTRLLVAPDPGGDRIVGRLRFDAGTRDEAPEQVGLLAVLERTLLAGGSLLTRPDELANWLSDRGASLTVAVGLERLELLFECAPADLANLLERVQGLLLTPSYPAALLEAARDELARGSEGRPRTDRDTILSTLEVLAWGPDAPRTRRPELETIEAIDRQDLIGFHRTHLGLNRLWVALAGPITPEAAALTVEHAFRDLGRVPARNEVPPGLFRTVDRTTLWMIDRPRAETVELILATPSLAPADQAHPARALWLAALAEREKDLLRIVYASGLVGPDGAPSFGQPGDLTLVEPAAGPLAGAELAAFLRRAPEALREAPDEQELLDARARLLACLAVERTPLERLELALETSFRRAPREFWQRYAERLAEVDVKLLATIATRAGNPRRWLGVALGPARALREAAGSGSGLQLEVFRSEARPRGTPEGLALAERMLTALGGAERWAQLSSLYTTGQAHIDGLGEPVGLRIWRDLDGRRLRLEQHTGGQRSVQVVTRESGWSRNQGNFSDLQDVQHARVVQREERQLFQLLYDLATRRGVFARLGEAPGENPDVEPGERLELVRRRELLCWIELDAQDRPARLGYDGLDGEVEYLFEEWTVHDGYPYPARVLQPANSATFEWDGFVPGPALAEDLFRRPVK